MKIYKIIVKEYTYENYTEFIVLGKSINDMLENLYKELFPDESDIPYYLRSSNFDIKCLGNFEPDRDFKSDVKILCSSYMNA